MLSGIRGNTFRRCRGTVLWKLLVMILLLLILVGAAGMTEHLMGAPAHLAENTIRPAVSL